MTTLAVGNIKSTTTSPPVIRNSSNTEIGYFCRAWVNFNGSGTVSIRGSGNVSSITDLGVGYYQINFSTSMSDVNYNVVCNRGDDNDGTVATHRDMTMHPCGANALATGSVRVQSKQSQGSGNATVEDCNNGHVSIFR
jgi:hypothetical protein